MNASLKFRVIRYSVVEIGRQSTYFSVNSCFYCLFVNDYTVNIIGVTLEQFLIFEIRAALKRGMFFGKHTETIEYVNKSVTFSKKCIIQGNL